MLCSDKWGRLFFLKMVKIKTIESANPQELAAPKKIYAYAIADRMVNLERYAYLVSNLFIVHKSNSYFIYHVLQYNIIDELYYYVKSAHLNFKYAKRLLNILTRLEFKLISGLHCKIFRINKKSNLLNSKLNLFTSMNFLAV